MINSDSTTTSTNHHPSNPTIIFECNDFRRDTGLILLKRTKSNNDDKNKYELQLYDDIQTKQLQ